MIHHLLGFAARGDAVAAQLDAEQEPDAADVGDQRMTALQVVHSPERPGAQRPRALEQVLALDHFERRQRRGAADGALLVRVMAERAVRGDVEIAARDQRGHREHGASQTLAQHDHVRDDAVMLEREHPAGPAQADRHLVENQQRAVTIAGVADDAVVLGGRDLDVGAADRFDDHGADVLFLAEHVVEVFRALRVAGAAATEAAGGRVARRRVLGPRHERTHVLAEDRFAADRDGVERRPVETVPQRQRLVAAGRDARELQRHADRERAAGREQNLAQRVGRERGEPRGEIDGGLVRVPAGREGQGVELALDRRHHVRMAVAHLMDVVAVEIHDAAAFDVGEPHALAGGERVEAGRGQRLMQEDLGVGVEQCPRGGVHVRLLELAAQRRGVDVALGGGIGRREGFDHGVGGQGFGLARRSRPAEAGPTAQ